MPLVNWIHIVITALAVTAVGWALHSIDVKRIEYKAAQAIEAQKTADLKQCNIDKQITREANDAIQKDRDAIARRLASAKLRLPAACTPVARAAELPDSGQQYAGAHGIRAEWLLDFAAECEEYRTQITVCSNFINQERKTEK